MFKIVLIEQGTGTVYRVKGSNPIRLAFSVLRFVRQKYGGD
ncbi:hypothetical protein [Geoglobus ahangari]